MSRDVPWLEKNEGEFDIVTANRAGYLNGAFNLAMPVFLYILLRACAISLRELAGAVAARFAAAVMVIASAFLFQVGGWLAHSKPWVLLNGGGCNWWNDWVASVAES